MAKIFMLEGYDGSGKTSVAKEIAKRLGIRYCHFFSDYGIQYDIEPLSVTEDELINMTKKALDKGVTMIVTADHGNAEWMYNEETHAPQTAHTTNVVPFIIVDKNKYNLKETGALCDIAPTILDLMKLNKPSEMTGNSLIKH